ncbi:MAG: hypothetical protein V7608_4088, partial [Hyphomicrobiales bacterium]
MGQGRAKALPFLLAVGRRANAATRLAACCAAAYVWRVARIFCYPAGRATGVFLRSSEPIFNVPAVVTATLAVLVLAHVIRMWVLTPEQDIELLLMFSFIPARYDATLLAQGGLPGGLGAEIWT